MANHFLGKTNHFVGIANQFIGEEYHRDEIANQKDGEACQLLGKENQC
jgi:hypothetical protein